MSVYTAVLSRSDDGYDVGFPDVPGCITYGDTIEEAIHMAKDALGGCLCAYEDEGVPLPDPRLPDQVPLNEGEFAVMVDIDTAEYRRQTDTRAVRKNVSLPAWMAYQAEQRGINCSQLLQDALRQALT
ncbi:MAG: type II toxin-antitoxin system HicB family antitoxin [Clostridia bacterium]|nr:type II toxin-antitoxin system HicB family antitoxin [Clostridia bacterium]